MNKKLIIFIIFILLLIAGGVFWRRGKVKLFEPKTEIPDPSSVYCTGLGYRDETRKGPQGGEIGICILAPNVECGTWDFFTGKCGQEYTFCEKHRGKIITTKKGCRFSLPCGLCILPDGRKCYEWDYFKGKCP